MSSSPGGSDALWQDSAEGLAFAWNPGSESANGGSTRGASGDDRAILDGWNPVDPLDTPNPTPTSEAAPDFSLHFDAASRAEATSISGDTAVDSGVVPTRELPQPVIVPTKPRRFPRPGEVIAQFRVISELGRGGFARVYLAEQSVLADRPVALKVAANLGNEPRNLARLQHTHIVPIHSVHDDEQTGWRLICMPYVGGANLAQVLRGAGVRLPSLATGRSLVEALDRVGQEASMIASARGHGSGRLPSAGMSVGETSGSFAPPSTGGEAWAATRAVGSPSRARSLWGRYFARFPWWNELAEVDPDENPREETEPARRYLLTATYVQAAIWIVARLAEGLQHAHERGLLHRDLKPSNILIAADGTPMLLDFNLSTDVRLPTDEDGAAREMIGGTLPYMAPEHLDAFSPEGTTPPEAVGPAADLYSLGLILFEMVTGEHPFADPPPGAKIAETIRRMREERLAGAPSARAINPAVPWGLESVLKRCLDPDPDRRYNLAGHFAEDLRRLLDDRPLKHVPELSLREVVAKWARRNPRASSASTISALALLLLLVVGSSAWVVADRLKDAQARERLAAFERSFSECQLLLNTASGPVEHIDRGLALADAALGAFGVRTPAAWEPSPAFQRLAEPDQERLREQLSELIALRARGKARLAEQQGQENERTRALSDGVAWLTLAEQIDPAPSFALFSDRAGYRAALGDIEGARTDRDQAARRPPTSARDLTLLGTSLLARGQVDQAEAPLVQATALQPDRFWSWFALGLCHFQQGRFADAASEFGFCSVLAPQFAWPHFNRGLALAAAGRLVEARAAYDAALADNPDFLAARLNRALVLLELDELTLALEDLDRALALGHRDAPTLAARADALAQLNRRGEAERDFADALRQQPRDVVTRVARGFFRLGVDPRGALGDFTIALRLQPDHARAHLGLALLQRKDDPHAALAHLDQALATDPNFLDALELRALIRGRLGDPAAESDVDRLERVPTAERLYNAACAMALLFEAGKTDRHARRALDLLRRAIALGFDRPRAATDPDLASLTDQSELRALLAPTSTPVGSP